MSGPTPVLEGYEVEAFGDGWIARPLGGGLALLGNDQNELNAARHRVLSAGLSRLSGASLDSPDGSVSPP